MKYCKDCKYFTGIDCQRIVDHPVRGASVPLNLSANIQRLGPTGILDNDIWHNQIGYCGLAARYWEEKPKKGKLNDLAWGKQ